MQNFKKTTRMLKYHRILVYIISLVIFIGPSISAIRIGVSPILGPVVALLISILFVSLLIYLNKQAVRGLYNRDFNAWFILVFLSFKMSFLIFGIPALKELLNKDNRKLFFKDLT